MELAFLDEEEGKELANFIREGYYIKALEMAENLLRIYKESNDAWNLQREQGHIFSLLAGKEANSDLGFVYKLASVECFSVDERLSRLATQGLFELGEFSGSELYYKKCLKKAKIASSFDCSENVDVACSLEVKDENFFKDLIKTAECRIANGYKSSSAKSKKLAEPDSREVRELKRFWLGLDINCKRDFMKVRMDNLMDFVEGLYHKKGLECFDEVLDSVEKDKTWVFWMCRAVCGKKFCSVDECKQHLLQHHDVDFVPSSEQERVFRIGRDWARKISFGEWKPIDAEAAVQMIKNQLGYVKGFTRKAKNGWSEEWPVAPADEERSKLLKEIKLLLESFFRLKILPCSIRDWLMRFPVKQLGKLQVPEQSIIDLHIAETPQSICFLVSHDLSLILDILKRIKSKRNDGTDIVCRAVDSIVDHTRVREKMDFDPDFSFLLLDKRLLKSKRVPFEDDFAINTFDPNAHYAEAPAKGDQFISWLLDPLVDTKYPTSVRENNLDIWVAVLKAVQFTCNSLGRKYERKMQFSDYEAALTELENLCRKEWEGDKRIRFAQLLCEICEERLKSGKMNDNTELFLCAVQDVLEGSVVPTFDFTTFENCLSRIRKCKSGLSNLIVLKSIRLLKSVAFHKVLLIDSKILLIDNSRISLLDNLVRLSVFDNRTHILRVVKPFMLTQIGLLKSKTKSHNAEAELLLEEEKRKQLTLKKKDNRNKDSMPIPLGRNVAETLLSSSDNLPHVVVDMATQTLPIDPLTPGQSAELDILKEISEKISRTIPVADAMKDLNKERESLLAFIAVCAAFTNPSSLFTPPGGIDQGLVRWRESPVFGAYAMSTFGAFFLSWFNFAYIHKYLTDNDQNTLTQEGRRARLRKRLTNSWIMLWITVALFFLSFATGMFLVIPNEGLSGWIPWIFVVLSAVKYIYDVYMFFGSRWV